MQKGGAAARIADDEDRPVNLTFLIPGKEDIVEQEGDSDEDLIDEDYQTQQERSDGEPEPTPDDSIRGPQTL